MQPTKQRLIMRREGTFTVKVSGANHCGVKSPLRVKYWVTAVCRPVLDERRFLFDQLSVQKFFDGISATVKSCEDLSMDCLHALHEVVRKENPKCQVQEMRVTLSPEPFLASMTYAAEFDEPPAVKEPVVPRVRWIVVGRPYQDRDTVVAFQNHYYAPFATTVTGWVKGDVGPYQSVVVFNSLEQAEKTAKILRDAGDQSWSDVTIVDTGVYDKPAEDDAAGGYYEYKG